MDSVDVPIPLPASTEFGDLVVLLPMKTMGHSVRSTSQICIELKALRYKSVE